MDLQCKRCGRLFDNDEEGADSQRSYCSRCMIELAEEGIPDEVEITAPKSAKLSKTWAVARWVILGFCVCMIALQAPELISSFKETKPIRYGTYVTDAQTDQCIKNLWHISRLLQEGKLPGKDLVCPASKKPYVVTKIKGDVTVSCPSPGLHGVRGIQISIESPAPEVKK